MNFHLKDGIYFRKTDDGKLRIVRAKDFTDEGELIAETNTSGLASIVASFSPLQEQFGSFQYILQFLEQGVMFCGGCGCRLTKEVEIIAPLSVVNLACCRTCYEQKFKPLFDWGMAASKR